jgi:CRP-like cAMP-binding protein
MQKTQNHAFDSILQSAGSRKISRNYGHQEVVFSQGDAADSMFYVASGHVKLSIRSKGGKRAILAILGQGDFFGENCLLRERRHTTTATAIQDSTIVRVHKGTIGGIMRQEPALSKRLILDLLARLERIQEDFSDQLLNTSEKRLARLLLRLSKDGHQTTPDLVRLHVSQATLAEMVGTTRSRVSYFMNRFRERGLIEYNGNLQVHRSLHAFLLQE